MLAVQFATIPKNEKERLSALLELNILDTKKEERFDSITKEAAEKFQVPIVTVSIIDKDREWFKSCQGLKNKQGPRKTSFCAHIMSGKHIFVIEDTLRDPRFSDNPQVISPPYVRFYAGVALHNRLRRLPVAVFCIKDTKPRKFSREEIFLLNAFAERAEEELNKQIRVKK